jgi:DegV family protein with EDD domain
MGKYRLIVDSSCDLPAEYYDKHDIGVTDLLINFGERSYRDRKDISSEEILKIAKEKNMLPKTAALNMADLSDVFTTNLQKYDHLFYLPISSNISSSFNNARLASQAFDGKVTALDSLQLSSGVALEAIGITRDIEAGLDVDTIVKNHEERRNRVQMQFVIDSMEWLYKGGRCSGLAFLLGNKLHLHPIIRLDDGKMGVYKLKRGKDIAKGIDQMTEEFLDQLNDGNIDLSFPILIPNVISNGGVKRVSRNLDRYIGTKILFPVEASGIITCHAGTETCGLAYMTKAPLKA